MCPIPCYRHDLYHGRAFLLIGGGMSRKKDVVDEAKELLKGPFSIAPGPEAETATPVIKGLLNEVKWLRRRLREIGG